ncbi:hypothetical protein ElyMa_004206100 [Elysia marginata]|uniref:Uncharacterized protein n=1 Tax=Elysia marginata TaxID=1093978 RepID=A0AAV4GNQ9_9GAST|nr:hypothetical protein ElyMa_004206100 [Elysia marginata]
MATVFSDYSIDELPQPFRQANKDELSANPRQLWRHRMTRPRRRPTHLQNVPQAHRDDFDGHFRNAENKGRRWPNTGTK